MDRDSANHVLCDLRKEDGLGGERKVYQPNEVTKEPES